MTVISSENVYYLFCNHWSQCGIGYAFRSGWYGGRKYNDTFSAVYTVQKMLDAADDYPGLKVSMELDAYAYESISKEDPECIERLIKYIREGKAAVEGGTYGQPFGQDYGWESNVRQLTYGLRTIKEILDYDVKAFLVEEQWFHPQLPQLLLKSGFSYASLQNQNSGQVKPIKETMILWRGLDGSSLPTIPANELMVSCVRQYTDYTDYEPILQKFNNPLLFQWVEVWPPGMDWGASCRPFEPAIRQILEWGAKPVSLGEYFDYEVSGRELKSIYIPMDESNYVNTWYQNGGWGYDGDRVIVIDKEAEARLLSLEGMATLCYERLGKEYPEAKLKVMWKNLLILQNHDSSVARSYRVYTTDGLESNAGSLVLSKYKEFISACNNEILNILNITGNGETANTSYVTWNTSGKASRRTVKLQIPIKSEFENPINIAVKQGSQIYPLQVQSLSKDFLTGWTVLDFPQYGDSQFELLKEDTNVSQTENDFTHKYGETWIEDETNRIEWIEGSWTIKITEKATGQVMEFTAFSGTIAKQNEHDGMFYPALSSAHMVFSFAFDGTTHSPDQVSKVEASVETKGPIRSTLVLYSKLLTLHTTETPVAFARAEVSIEHVTGRIECKSFLHTGIYLSVNSEAVFTHNLEKPKYFRDFPFGEERTDLTDFSANTYIRATDGVNGFTLVHPGVQRVRLTNVKNGCEVRHLISRGRILGDYEWTFSLYFGNHQPHESISLSKNESAYTPTTYGKLVVGEFLQIEDQRLIVSSLNREFGLTALRITNFSNDVISKSELRVSKRYDYAYACDFRVQHLSNLEVFSEAAMTTVAVDFQPWEVKTIVLI